MFTRVKHNGHNAIQLNPGERITYFVREKSSPLLAARGFNF